MTTPRLFQPGRLGATATPSRVVMAPMTRSRADGRGVVGPITAAYYAQRASAGLIITEGTQPSPQGQGYARTPGIHSEAQVEAWRAVTDAVHAAGGRIALQVMHVGRIGHPLNQAAPAPLVAPSAIAARGDIWTDAEGMQPMPAPEALTEAGIADVLSQYEAAATNARRAGFDAVELHAANGYLPMQFLSTGSNTRTDGWGGTPERRARFVLEAARRMAGAIGADRVGLRISPGNPYNDMQDDDPVATYTALLGGLRGMGLAWVHAQRAGWDGLLALRPLIDAPFVLTGGFTGEAAEAALQAGEADFIGFGSTFLANPDLPARLAGGLPLNPPDPTTFFAGGERGYVDYPALTA